MVELPDTKDTCRTHWESLVQCLSVSMRGQDPIFALLEQTALKDDFELEPVVDENGLPTEIPSCPQDRFYLRAAAPEERNLESSYIGYLKRISDDKSRYTHSPEKVAELRHQVGLRLSGLLGLTEGKNGLLFFTSHLMGYSNQIVNKEFIDSLLNSEDKTLKYVQDKIID